MNLTMKHLRNNMKKLLILTALIISINIYSFNSADANTKNIELLKQHLAVMYNNEQKEINKNTIIAATAGMGSKAALIGSIILLSSNRPKQALISACAYGLLETVWFSHASKVSASRTNASMFEFIYTFLPAQNALPNDKNQQ